MIPAKHKINGNHDGDTLYVDVQLMGTLWLIGEKMRIVGVNCPELGTPEGIAAAEFTKDWLKKQYTLDLKPMRDKYGRLLGDLVADNGERLSAALLSSGHAVAYRDYEDDLPQHWTE